MRPSSPEAEDDWGQDVKPWRGQQISHEPRQSHLTQSVAMGARQYQARRTSGFGLDRSLGAQTPTQLNSSAPHKPIRAALALDRAQRRRNEGPRGPAIIQKARNGPYQALHRMGSLCGPVEHTRQALGRRGGIIQSDILIRRQNEHEDDLTDPAAELPGQQSKLKQALSSNTSSQQHKEMPSQRAENKPRTVQQRMAQERTHQQLPAGLDWHSRSRIEDPSLAWHDTVSNPKPVSQLAKQQSQGVQYKKRQQGDYGQPRSAAVECPRSATSGGISSSDTELRRPSRKRRRNEGQQLRQYNGRTIDLISDSGEEKSPKGKKAQPDGILQNGGRPRSDAESEMSTISKEWRRREDVQAKESDPVRFGKETYGPLQFQGHHGIRGKAPAGLFIDFASQPEILSQTSLFRDVQVKAVPYKSRMQVTGQPTLDEEYMYADVLLFVVYEKVVQLHDQDMCLLVTGPPQAQARDPVNFYAVLLDESESNRLAKPQIHSRITGYLPHCQKSGTFPQHGDMSCRHLNVMADQVRKSIIDEKCQGVASTGKRATQSVSHDQASVQKVQTRTQNQSQDQAYGAKSEISYATTSPTLEAPKLTGEIARLATRRSSRTAPRRQNLDDGLPFPDLEEKEAKVLFLYPPSPQDPDRVTLTDIDQKRVQPGEFLNDNIIDFCFKYYVRELVPPNLKEWIKRYVHIFSTHFFSKLTESQPAKPREKKQQQEASTPAAEGASEGERKLTKQEQRQRCRLDKMTAAHNLVERWTKNLDLFSKKMVFVPVNEFLHWSLAVICNLDKIHCVQVPVKENKKNKAATGRRMSVPAAMTGERAEHAVPSAPSSHSDGAHAQASSNPTSPKTRLKEGREEHEEDCYSIDHWRTERVSCPTGGIAQPSGLGQAALALQTVGSRQTKGARNCVQGVSERGCIGKGIGEASEHAQYGAKDEGVPIRDVHWGPVAREAGQDDTALTQGSIESQTSSQTDMCPADLTGVPCIVFMDSLSAHAKGKICDRLLEYLEMEWRKRKPDMPLPPISRSTVPTISPQIPRQDNSCDCGVFTIMYGEKVLQRHELIESMTHADVQRRLDRVWQPKDFDQEDVARKREEITKVFENLTSLFADAEKKRQDCKGVEPGGKPDTEEDETCDGESQEIDEQVLSHRSLPASPTLPKVGQTHRPEDALDPTSTQSTPTSQTLERLPSGLSSPTSTPPSTTGVQGTNKAKGERKGKDVSPSATPNTYQGAEKKIKGSEPLRQYLADVLPNAGEEGLRSFTIDTMRARHVSKQAQGQTYNCHRARASPVNRAVVYETKVRGKQSTPPSRDQAIRGQGRHSQSSESPLDIQKCHRELTGLNALEEHPQTTYDQLHSPPSSTETISMPPLRWHAPAQVAGQQTPPSSSSQEETVADVDGDHGSGIEPSPPRRIRAVQPWTRHAPGSPGSDMMEEAARVFRP